MKSVLPVLLALLVFGCAAKEEEPPPEENVVTVDVAEAATSPIQLRISADAVIFPLQQAAIVPKVQAPVRKLYVDRGSHVRAGQLLAELENRDMAAALTESQAAFAQAEAAFETASKATIPEEVQKAELDARAARDVLDAQQKIFDSRQTLYKEGAIAQRDVNEAQVNLTQARNQYEITRTHLESVQRVSHEQSLKAAAAQRDAAKGRYDAAQAQFGYTRITSPIDGVVTDRPVYEGEMPPAGGPMITVMDLSEIIARAHVSQENARQLKPGDAAAIVPPDGGAIVPGKVYIISPALDPGSTTVEVWIRAANPGERLKPGAGMRVDVVTKTVNDALVIPQSAVVNGESGQTVVIAAGFDNRPHKKEVQLGIRDGDNVQVTEGLEAGERVITNGSFALDKLEDHVLARTKLQINPLKDEHHTGK